VNLLFCDCDCDGCLNGEPCLDEAPELRPATDADWLEFVAAATEDEEG
jgi:hypothetical protein